jgi:hypothetical protein
MHLHSCPRCLEKFVCAVGGECRDYSASVTCDDCWLGYQLPYFLLVTFVALAIIVSALYLPGWLT